MTPYSTFIAKSRYSRYLNDKNRREHWNETVSRYFTFMFEHLEDKYNYKPTEALRTELTNAVQNLEVMPSMRAIMTAGKALDRDNTAGYNCSYLPIDDPKAFDEAMYILLCGTGVGFSVEHKYVNQLPEVPEQLFDSQTTIVVADSKEGWAKALRQLIALLYSGEVARYDLSRIRPAGARLKTFGGRASGPGPLDELFKFTTAKFRGAVGRKLTSIECHDILCKIGEVVVVGGVRRSAMISLSDLEDDRMRSCKSGNWWEQNAHRALANNSATYNSKPDIGQFLQEWTSLYNSHSGERGIFSREASQSQAAKNGRRDSSFDFGTNPCSEIILRPYQFCNLTEVVVRANDTRDSLKRKVRLATILGTIQSTLTNFQFLSSDWVKNTAEERLLGVSLTGIMDAKITNTPDPKLLEELRDVARSTNEEYAKKFDIAPSASITCVKPSGTVSQLVDSASGIHARHNDFYTRRIRMDKKDPIYDYLKEMGVTVEDEVFRPDSTAVFSFPMKAPKDAILRNDKTAIEQLEIWLIYQRHWCEHKPSVTISVKDEEWHEVGAWVWKHFDEISGVSFLPHSNHTYQQAPYEYCSEEQYKELLAKTPSRIDWANFLEVEDNTTGQQTLACTAGSCEI